MTVPPEDDPRWGTPDFPSRPSPPGPSGGGASPWGSPPPPAQMPPEWRGTGSADVSGWGAPPPPAWGDNAGWGAAPLGAPGVPVVTVASMGLRLLARILDGLFVGLIVVVAFMVFGRGALDAVPLDALLIDPETGEPADAAAAAAAVAELTRVAVIWSAIWLLVGGVYEVTLIAQRGATLGKQAVGIRVVNETDAGPVSWGHSTVRWLLPFGVGLLCGAGLLLIWVSPFFDSSGRRQGWHDRLARTLVVRAG